MTETLIDSQSQMAAARFLQRVELTLYESVQEVTGIKRVTDENREHFDTVYLAAAMLCYDDQGENE